MRICRFCLVSILLLLSFQLLAATQYGLNETDWRVVDNNPAGASVAFVDEPLLGKAVPTTNGDGRSNGYMVGGFNSTSGWNNQSEFLLSWHLRASENVTFYVRVDTTLGWRYLYYNYSTKNNLLNASGRYIHHGLGTTFADGNWHTWSQDLEADLKDAEPDNELLAVNGIVLRGNMQIDGVTLSAQNQSPQAVIDASAAVIDINDTLVLDGQNSTDADGDIVAYVWRNEAGDNLSEDTIWQSLLSAAGEQRFSLEVTDDDGLSAVTSTLVTAIDFQSIPDTRYGLNESDWRVVDNTPAGASVVFEDEPLLGRAVPTTNGDGRSNGYMVGGFNSASGWNNEFQFLLSWHLRASENVTFYVRVDTTLGWRYLYYNYSTKNNLLNASGRYIHHGLGTTFADGNWHTWSQDLEADLKDAEPDNELLAVNGIVLRGNMQIDGVTLSAQNQSPQAVIDASSAVVDVNDMLVLDGQSSTDADGEIVIYVWRNEVGDIISAGDSWQGVLQTEGQLRFSLKVTDNDNLSAVTSILVDAVDVTVPAPVTPVNSSPVVDTRIEAGTTVSFVWQEQAVANAYDFHLFNRVTAELSYVYDIDPAIACDAGQCTMDAEINLPIHADHAWRVRAKNESGTSAWSRSEFDVIEPLTSAPAAPVINLPADNIVFEPNEPITLQWQSDPLASSYDFGLFNPLADSTTYNSSLDPMQICSATICTLIETNDVPIGEGYQLLVRATNRLGNSDWSVRTFSVAEPVTEPPATPINIGPDVGVELVEGRIVEFSWDATELAASYDFHFFDNVSKQLQYTNDLLASDVCTDGVCRLSTEIDLPVFDNHAWRVRAANTAGKSNWSRSLFNVIPVPDLAPAMPVNVAPAVNAILIASSTQQFSWEPVADASAYDFHLFDVLEGELPFVLNLNAVDICGASVCEYESDIMSTVAVGHAWRVRAVNEDGSSNWSRSAFTARNEADTVPTADFTASTVFGTAPLIVSVDAASSSDSVGITDYQWDFSGQQSIEGIDAVSASHEFAFPGVYTISLTVFNAAGLSDSKAIDVTVTDGIPEDAPSKTEAARLLAQASFGASNIAIQQVRQLGLEGWIDSQLELQGPRHLDYVTAYSNGSNRDARHEIWWLDAVDGDDQLRQRVAFALSQLLVVSDSGFTLANAQYGVTNYYDMLRENAFGNYRELLEEVTLSPVMGIYLSMLQNDKGSELINTRADENFAREVLQLFSIGLHNLNQDGSLATGNTFTQDDIESFARVFTGWNYKDAGQWDRSLFTGQDLINPMEAFEDHHDSEAKTLLDGFQVPAGQTARADLEMALDNIFAHQNVAPFVSLHLIKQLTTSNPTPAYVERVASVFNDNGGGIKGDLGATVKAILMDTEARNSTELENFGKLREPVLRLSHLWRAFSIAPGNLSSRGEYNTYSTELKNIETITGQAVLRSPSVFNFFSPTYSPSGPVQSAQLVSPEFEIFTDSNILSVASRINDQIHRHYKQNPTASELNPSYLDFADEIALAEEPQELLDHLNVVLLSGLMSEELNGLILNHLLSLPADESGYRLRAQDAVSLIVASPEYLVQR